MGKVKTEQIKRLAKQLIARYPTKFSTNFEENKRAVEALTQGATPRVRNQIAGYITRALAQKATASTETVEETSLAE
ncbi:MAG: 30S ribosomal protein S17e [Candidatus Bathyarchaeia archaeon]